MFEPSQMFKSITGSAYALPVRNNGDRAWIEKTADNGNKYRIQVYGIVDDGLYHEHQSFNTIMSVKRAERRQRKALGHDRCEEDHRWPRLMRAAPSIVAEGGGEDLLARDDRPVQHRTEQVRHARHGNPLTTPFGKAYA